MSQSSSSSNVLVDSWAAPVPRQRLSRVHDRFAPLVDDDDDGVVPREEYKPPCTSRESDMSYDARLDLSLSTSKAAEISAKVAAAPSPPASG